MPTPLRVLLVEDSEDDAAIEVLELRRAGFEPEWRRVDTREEMIAALAEGPWEVVLCDHAMPSFNSERAVEVLRERGLDIPVIIVSGVMGEDTAVEALRTGAADYVLKGNLRRLGPAVARALREEVERRRLREVEEGLRRNLDRQRMILGTLPLALYTAAPGEPQGTTWISRNVERLSGFPASRFTEEAGFWESRVHPEDLPTLQKSFRGIAAAGAAAVEYRWRTADGRWRWFLDHAIVAVDAEGRPAEMLGVWLDITDRKVLERQFQESQKMEIVGRLAGGVAHDFNNLLTVILGYSELVLGGLPPESPHRTSVTEIRRAGERAASLTRQLLAFSRRQVLELKALDLNRVVGEMERMIRRLIGEDVRFETTLAPGLRAIRADPGQVEQVVLNLVVNARDAMPEGGTLALRTEAAATAEGEEDGFGGVLRAGSWVSLSVSDTGVGMDEPTRRRILEPFFTTKSAGKGTGLGLATVHSIVHQSGGQIAVRSEPGRGTSFRVLLPPTDEVPAGAEPPPPAAAAPAAGLVLLVEDDPAIRELVAESLRSAGYRVRAAVSAETALALLPEEPREPIALLLTDLVLQGMNGFELARRFRLQRPGVPVLGMTGYIDRGSLEGPLRAAMDGILRKPFSPDVLLRRVAEVLAAARPRG